MALVAVWPDPITGRIAFLTPTPTERMNGEDATAFARRIADKDVPHGIVYTLIDQSQMPATFRWSQPYLCAWRLVNGAVVEDLPTAKAIRKVELLAEKAVRVVIVRDKASMADETGGDSKVHKARIKTLQGLDQTIDAQLAAVASLTALAAFIPTELQTAD